MIIIIERNESSGKNQCLNVYVIESTRKGSDRKMDNDKWIDKVREMKKIIYPKCRKMKEICKKLMFRIGCFVRRKAESLKCVAESSGIMDKLGNLKWKICSEIMTKRSKTVHNS